MNAFLDERYFEWLKSQVASVEDSPKTYERLLHKLYQTEFVWLVPNDDNRVEDGKYLRYRFRDDEGIDITATDARWMSLECSMLELLVHLAQRLEFMLDQTPERWFWVLIKNAGLLPFDDDHFNDNKANDILERIIWRQYDASGQGGLFPLQEPPKDQREVELWYQLNHYVGERM